MVSKVETLSYANFTFFQVVISCDPKIVAKMTSLPLFTIITLFLKRLPGMNFADRLAKKTKEKGTPVVVGLDPRFASLPKVINSQISENDLAAMAEAFELFCEEVIDVIADKVPAIKPQAAFFEELGPHGMVALKKVIDYARQKDLLVILDGKRNDIGSTATAYAKGYLGAKSPWSADSLTVSPYLGDDSLTPFVDVCQATDSGLFVLVKTSNPGGKFLQDISHDGAPLYEYMGQYVEALAQRTAGQSGYGAVGAVIGATYPQQLQDLRQKMKTTWFLVPGYGAQGGGAGDVAGAFDENGLGASINSSRGIIFAYSQEKYRNRYSNWQDSVAHATEEMKAALAAETPAKNLLLAK